MIKLLRFYFSVSVSYKTKVESVQLGKPPTEVRVLRKVCVVVVGV